MRKKEKEPERSNLGLTSRSQKVKSTANFMKVTKALKRRNTHGGAISWFSMGVFALARERLLGGKVISHLRGFQTTPEIFPVKKTQLKKIRKRTQKKAQFDAWAAWKIGGGKRMVAISWQLQEKNFKKGRDCGRQRKFNR